MRTGFAGCVARLVPSRVSVAEGLIDDFSDDLAACERRAVERSVEKRRREFAAGRACARAALRRLGIAPAPILPGRRREPLWRSEIVGSITHTDSYCAAAVARADGTAALGIDVERADRLDAAMVRMICSAAELRRCERAAPPAFPCAAVLFSIKESIFKALYPLLGIELAFLDVVLELRFGHGTFRARSARESDAAGPALRALDGAFAAGARNVLSAAWITGSCSAARWELAPWTRERPLAATAPDSQYCQRIWP